MLRQEEDNSLVYHRELLATIVAIEDPEWEKQIKGAYTGTDLVADLLETPREDSVAQDEQGILHIEGKVYIPETLREEFVREQHKLPTHRHQGIQKTFERI